MWPHIVWRFDPNPTELESKRSAIASLCRVGGTWVEGRRRPNGMRSRTWEWAFHAPKRNRHFAKREAERMFIINLQLTWLLAKGEPPATTACEERKGPFVRFVEDCLTRAGATDVAPVKVINAVAQAREDERLKGERRKILAMLVMHQRVNN